MDTLEELWNQQELERIIREELQEEHESQIDADEESLELDIEESDRVVARGRPTGDRPDD